MENMGDLEFSHYLKNFVEQALNVLDSTYFPLDTWGYTYFPHGKQHSFFRKKIHGHMGVSKVHS